MKKTYIGYVIYKNGERTSYVFSNKKEAHRFADSWYYDVCWNEGEDAEFALDLKVKEEEFPYEVSSTRGTWSWNSYIKHRREA